MKLVVRAQLRFLWRARGSLLSALLGMTIGVASIVGVHLLSAEVARQVERTAQPLGTVDLYLQRDGLTDADYFQLRRDWREGLLPAVSALFPLFEQRVEYGAETLLVIGTDPLAAGVAVDQPGNSANSEADPAGQLASGLAAYLSQDTVYVGAELAAKVGASIELAGRPLRVLGTSAPAGVVLGDLPTVRSLGAHPAELSRIGVRLHATEQPRSVSARLLWLANRLFPGALPLPAARPLEGLDETADERPWQQTPATLANPTQKLLQSVLFNIAALSVLALVVAWLLTYQVACHALARRRNMFDRLHSLGVSQRRLLGLTQTEGLVLGVCATLLGAGVGVWLANLLRALTLGGEFSWLLQLDGWVWLKALVSGVGVAGLSYLLAARMVLFGRQGSALPNRVVQADVAGAESVSQVGSRVGAKFRTSPWFGFVVLGTAFCWGLFVPASGLPGAFVCIVACCLLLIFYLPTVAGWAFRASLANPSAPAGTKRRSPLKLLGLRQVLVGQELRLGISALALALATALGISVMVDSFRGAFLGMLERRLADDIVITFNEAPNDVSRAELSRLIEEHAESLFWRGEVAISAAGSSGQLEFADNHTELLLRFVDAGDIERARPTAAGSVSDSSAVGGAVTRDSVFVNESFARQQNLQAGSLFRIRGSQASAEVVVGGIYSAYGEVSPRLLGGLPLARKLAGIARHTRVYVKTASETRLREALADSVGVSGSESARRLDKRHGRASWTQQALIRQRSIEIFEQTFAITRALTWLALLVAVVALANALAAHGLQQQGTHRQLTVLGLGAPAARRLRLQRTLYATAIALLLAAPLGFAIAAILCGVVNPRAFGWSFAMQLTSAGVGWPLLGGVAGGLLAALLGAFIARQQRRGGGVLQVAAEHRSPLCVGLLGLILVLLLGGCSPTDEPHRSAAPVPGLRVGNLLGAEAHNPGTEGADGFLKATTVRTFEFPADHGAHPAYRSEWWYLTCPLAGLGPAAGAEYGVQFTLFRQGLVPPATSRLVPAKTMNEWRSGQVYMAHAALTSVQPGGSESDHVEASRFARGHPQLAGVQAQPFAAWLENWRLAAPTAELNLLDSITSADDALVPLALTVRDSAFQIDLKLSADKPLVLQGDRGLSYKGSSEASYYYSFPRLAASGTVAIADQSPDVLVQGSCWLDREWSTSVLARELVGWDWFALQFNDQTELMLFRLRGAEPATASSAQPANNPSRQQGKRIDAQGAAHTLSPEQLVFVPVRRWRDESGVDWPVEWSIATGKRNLRVVAALDDQRMRSSVPYWEGLVWVYEGEQRIGQGYLEMTGYE